MPAHVADRPINKMASWEDTERWREAPTLWPPADRDRRGILQLLAKNIWCGYKFLVSAEDYIVGFLREHNCEISRSAALFGWEWLVVANETALYYEGAYTQQRDRPNTCIMRGQEALFILLGLREAQRKKSSKALVKWAENMVQSAQVRARMPFMEKEKRTQMAQIGILVLESYKDSP